MAERTCSIEGCERPHCAQGYCKPCYYRLRAHGELDVLPSIPAEQRFWAKVDKNGPVPEHRPELGPCWLWTGNRTRAGDRGHGRFYPGPGPEGVVAHRYAYELLVGPIPTGLVLDHLCRVRPCVNPVHLEPVTAEENVGRGISFSATNARKTHCDRGHELSPDRKCRICSNAAKRAHEKRMEQDPQWRERRRALERERYHARKEHRP